MKHRPSWWSAGVLAACVSLAATGAAWGQPTGSQAQARAGDTAAPGADWRPAERDAEGLGPWRFTLHLENDSALFIPNSPSDRHYTNGTAFSFAWRPRFAEQAAEAIPRLGGDFGDNPGTAFGVMLGQLIFTPNNIELTVPQPDDRPFAGYLFVGGHWQRSGEKTLDHVQLDVGVTGPPSLAEPIQEIVHDVFPNSEDPGGWDNQIESEPTLQLTLRRKWRSNPDAVRFDLAGLPMQVQGIAGAELDLGTVLRQLEGTLLARVGYRLPDDFGPGRLSEPASFTANPARGWSFYLFGRLTGRLVEHNLFLEGSDFRNPDHPTVTKNPFVGEAAAGLAVNYARGGWSVGLNYAQVYSMQEFEQQSDNHSYGRYSLSLQREF